MKNATTEQADRHTLDGDRLVSVTEAAAQLGLCRQTIHKLVHRGEIPAVVGDGHRAVIWVSDLDAWLREQYTG